MIKTKILYPQRFEYYLRQQKRDLTEEEKKSGKFSAGTYYIITHHADEEQLAKYPKKVQDIWRKKLDDNLKVKGGESSLYCFMGLDETVNDFIEKEGINQKNLIDIQYQLTGTSEDNTESAMIIWNGKRGRWF